MRRTEVIIHLDIFILSLKCAGRCALHLSISKWCGRVVHSMEQREGREVNKINV